MYELKDVVEIAKYAGKFALAIGTAASAFGVVAGGARALSNLDNTEMFYSGLEALTYGSITFVPLATLTYFAFTKGKRSRDLTPS